ncbi:MAG: hypothetical protein QOJ96_456 [Alphaproteobacteria bacterium]|jgi:hypothetical protein|nr:hypothetical protein [Alphaproteobacteria bacterium]
MTSTEMDYHSRIEWFKRVLEAGYFEDREWVQEFRTIRGSSQMALRCRSTSIVILCTLYDNGNIWDGYRIIVKDGDRIQCREIRPCGPSLMERYERLTHLNFRGHLNS